MFRDVRHDMPCKSCGLVDRKEGVSPGVAVLLMPTWPQGGGSGQQIGSS